VKKYWSRLALIFLFIALSVYYLQYSVYDAQYQTEAKSKSGLDSLEYVQENEESMRDARANRIKLGLDLQGGMYVTLEVAVAEMLEKMAKNKDERLREVLVASKTEADESDEPFLDIFMRQFESRGIRMSRYYGDIRDENSDVYAMLQDETAKAVDRAEEIINNREPVWRIREQHSACRIPPYYRRAPGRQRRTRSPFADPGNGTVGVQTPRRS